MSEMARRIIIENKIKHERGEDSSILDLGNCGLTELPIAIGDLIWLEKLILSSTWLNFDYDNKKWVKHKSQNSGPENRIIIYANKPSLFGSFSKSFHFNVFKKLVNLKVLILDHNPVNNLSAISHLEHLEILSIGTSQIRDLAPLSKLVNLKQLYLDVSDVYDLSPLANLKNLKSLSFSFTKTEDASFLTQLINLESLHFTHTKIDSVSSISKLNRLKYLYFDSTRITNILPLSNLLNLVHLSFNDTAISDLSPLSKLTNLRYIGCANTKILNIYPLLSIIKNGNNVLLRRDFVDICVENCPLTTPPIEIIKQGRLAILKYFEEVDIAKQSGTLIRLSEAKCIIIGEGGSGKTSLTRKLLHPDNPLPLEKETTHGIDIHPLDFKLPDGTDFHLNIWDFGGQEIYHATHQFFLTKRSLYILLDDTRKDEKTVNVYFPQKLGPAVKLEIL